MIEQYNHILFPAVLFFATLTSVGLVFYIWPKRGGLPWALTFMLAMMAVAVWAFNYAFELIDPNLTTKIIWAQLQYPSIVSLPVLWLIFATQYTNHTRWLTGRNIVLLSLIPVATLIFVFTNQLHGLIWRDVALEQIGALVFLDVQYGAWFWINFASAYIMLFTGSGYLLYSLWDLPKAYRWQGTAVFFAALVPWLSNMLYISGFNPLDPLDLSPIAFAVTGCFVVWGVARHQFLDVVPLARRITVDNLQESVLVLDMKQRVIDANPAAQTLLGLSLPQMLGQPLPVLWPAGAHLAQPEMANDREHSKLMVERDGIDHYYEYRFSTIHAPNGQPHGRLLVLHDITALHRAQEALSGQKAFLQSLVMVARATSSRLDIEIVLQQTVDIATAITGSTFGNLLLLDGEQSTVRDSLSTQVILPVKRMTNAQVVLERGLAGWVVREKRVAIVDDTKKDARWVHIEGQPAQSCSALAVPIIYDDHVLGVITLQHTTTYYYTDPHVELMRSAAEQMALALHNAQMYERQRRQTHRQTVMYKLLRSVSEHLTFQPVANVATQTIRELAGWSVVALVVPHHNAQFEILAVSGALLHQQGASPTLVEEAWGQAYETGQTQVITQADYANHPDDLPRSGIFVPLHRSGGMLGILMVESEDREAFAQEDILLAEALADATALALSNAQAHSELHRYTANLSTLYDVARFANQSLVADQALDNMLYATVEGLEFTSGLVTLIDPHTQKLYLGAHYNLPPMMLGLIQQHGFAGTICAYVHETGRPIHIVDFETASAEAVHFLETYPHALEGLRQMQIKSYSGVPLTHNDRQLGTLCLFSHEIHDWSLEHQALRQAVSQQIAAAVANAELYHVVTREQRHLQTVVESSRDGIFLVNTELQLLVINGVAHEFLALPHSVEQWLDRSVSEMLLVLRHKARTAVTQLIGLLRQSQAMSPKQREFELDNRSLRWLSVPITGTEQELTGHLFILRDVTEERLLEKMRDDLMRTMVHDLRNPVSSVYTMAELVTDEWGDQFDEELIHFLGVIKTSARKSLRLINEILDLSRLESGRMPLHYGIAHLEDLVSETLFLQSPVADKQGIKLVTQLPEALPEIYVDPQLISRLLQNLVGNALKFTPTGGRVSITADITPTNLLVKVTDTGIGIAPKLQERLFQKFAKGHHQNSGSGLGLAFCKMALEAHHQNIWVAETSPQGTTFAFTLPFASEQNIDLLMPYPSVA